MKRLLARIWSRVWPDRIAARIALAILVAIGSAQLISVVVFVLLHPGPPAVYGLWDVLSAVRTAVEAARAGKGERAIAAAVGDDFDVAIEREPPPAEPAPRSLRRLAFALREALPPDAVVRVSRPQPSGFMRFAGLAGAPRAYSPPPPPIPGQPPPETPELSVGGWFVIHVELGEGRWLVLRPPGTPGPQHALAMAILWFGLIGIAVAAVAVLTGRRIVAPLGMLAAAARRFARERRASPVPAQGPQELREIIDAFNEMQRDLSRYVDERTRIAAALAHDLRTPLTRLRLALEREAPDDRPMMNREVMLAAIERMAGMIDATLAYARQDSAREPEQRVDLAALTQSVCDDLADLGFEAAYDGPARMVVTAQPSALRRAVANLVENACRHGGNALATIERGAEAVRLVVADDGPGIPPAQRELAFEPFRRLDESRSADSAGTGLGLALARAIARAHGGDVSLEGREPHGLRAILALPLRGSPG